MGGSGFGSGLGGATTVEGLFRELRAIQERQDRFQAHLDQMQVTRKATTTLMMMLMKMVVQAQMASDMTSFQQAYHEEKYRVQRLEDQLNDIIELNQVNQLNLHVHVHVRKGREGQGWLSGGDAEPEE